MASQYPVFDRGASPEEQRLAVQLMREAIEKEPAYQQLEAKELRATDALTAAVPANDQALVVGLADAMTNSYEYMINRLVEWMRGN